MQAESKIGGCEGKRGRRLVAHHTPRTAGAEQFDASDSVRVCRDEELQCRFQRRVRVAQQAGERGGERRVLDADGLRHTFLDADVAAFVGDSGQFVVTVGVGRGVERDRQIPVCQPSCDIKMIARAEIAQVVFQGSGGGGTY